MRFSLASIVLVPRGAWGPPPTRDQWREVLDWAAQTGFAGIELSPRWLDFHTLPERDLDLFRDDAAQAGLAISGLCISRCILTRTPQADEHWRRLQQGLVVAQRLGAPLLTLSLSMPTLPGPERPLLRGDAVPAEEIERSMTLVRQLALLAKECGVRLSLELHDDGLLDTPQRCLDFRARLDQPEVGVNPDLGNICRDQTTPVDWEGGLVQLAPHANNWHVKNYRAGAPAPVWDGDIDYGRAFQVMRSAGYGGWVSIESYFGNVRGLQERSLRFLKTLTAT